MMINKSSIDSKVIVYIICTKTVQSALKTTSLIPLSSENWFGVVKIA